MARRIVAPDEIAQHELRLRKALARHRLTLWWWAQLIQADRLEREPPRRLAAIPGGVNER